MFCIALGAKAQSPGYQLSQLTWLAGTWQRTNIKPERSGTEEWTQESDSVWTGRGVTLSGSDTLFIEKLKLIAIDGDIFYTADIPENQTEVYFKLTSVTDTSFSCENAQHDFPKKIVYQREGDRLKAIISGDGNTITYLFDRK